MRRQALRLLRKIVHRKQVNISFNSESMDTMFPYPTHIIIDHLSLLELTSLIAPAWLFLTDGCCMSGRRFRESNESMICPIDVSEIHPRAISACFHRTSPLAPQAFSFFTAEGKLRPLCHVKVYQLSLPHAFLSAPLRQGSAEKPCLPILAVPPAHTTPRLRDLRPPAPEPPLWRHASWYAGTASLVCFPL